MNKTNLFIFRHMAFEIRTHQPKKIERNTNYVKKDTPTHNLRTPIPRFQDQIEPSTQPTSSTSPILIITMPMFKNFQII